MVTHDPFRTVPPSPRNASGSGGKVTYRRPVWKFDKLLERLGHEREVSAKLVKRGYARVPENSILGWRLRNSIPAFWLPVIIQMGLDENHIRTIMDLRVRKQEPEQE